MGGIWETIYFPRKIRDVTMLGLLLFKLKLHDDKETQEIL